MLSGKAVPSEKNKELMLLLRIGIMCNNAHLEIKDNNPEAFGDPTEKALIFSAYNSGFIKENEVEKEMRIKEYSFSSNRKMMSIVRERDSQLISYVKGAPDVLLRRCDRESVGGKIINLTDRRRIELHSIYENMASGAQRVLAFAFKEVSTKFNQEIAEQGLIFVGFQGMLDMPRKEVRAAIEDCISAGIKIKMITGDSAITAKAVSEMIGLNGYSIEGHELEKLSEEEFNKAVKEKTIFARISPELKFRIVRCLKKQKEVVAVTGDGVNDILALKEAHIGIAMGIRGTDVARDVSDIILLDDNFSSIVSAVREGRIVYDNMKKSITAHITANVDEMFVVLFALLLAWPLPLMPLAILWMNLITDSLPCLSLSFEPQDKNIMRRKPISQKETILTGVTGFLLIAGILAFITTVGLFALYYKTDLEKARTIALTTAVFCEMFVVLSCRSKRNIWEIGFFSNKFLIYSIAITIGLQLIAIYSRLAGVFGFVPISITELLMIAAASSSIFVIFEAQKFYKSRKFKEV